MEQVLTPAARWPPCNCHRSTPTAECCLPARCIHHPTAIPGHTLEVSVSTLGFSEVWTKINSPSFFHGLKNTSSLPPPNGKPSMFITMRVCRQVSIDPAKECRSTPPQHHCEKKTGCAPRSSICTCKMAERPVASAAPTTARMPSKLYTVNAPTAAPRPLASLNMSKVLLPSPEPDAYGNMTSRLVLAETSGVSGLSWDDAPAGRGRSGFRRAPNCSTPNMEDEGRCT